VQTAKRRICLIKEIVDFASLFGTSLDLNEDFVLKKQDRYFLVYSTLKNALSENFTYAGVYLGKNVRGKFFPGFELLRMIAKNGANRVIIDDRTEWLFVCGRDIFKQGIIDTVGSGRKDEHVLVVNNRDECLGYGIIVADLDKIERGLAVENVLDIGDFLRREKEE
jgi:ribosome biogenesis protein Nip4